MRALLLAGVTVSALSATATCVRAADITYQGGLANSFDSVSYTITTDGNTGFLQYNDIMGYSISFQEGGQAPQTAVVTGSQVQNSYYNGTYSSFFGTVVGGVLNFTTTEIDYVANDNGYSAGLSGGALNDEVYFNIAPGTDAIRFDRLVTSFPAPSVVATVPEPASLALLGLPMGLAGLILARRHRDVAG